MIHDYENNMFPEDSNEWREPLHEGGWLDTLRQLWQWDELAAEIGQESQARIALVGVAGAGKSLLFNRLRGWVISGQEKQTDMADIYQLETGLQLESLGLFVLADLPTQSSINNMPGSELLLTLGDPALIVYLIDGAVGVQPDDFRWLATLRSGGKPLIVTLNKIDLLDNPDQAVAEATHKLGMPIIPISVSQNLNIQDGLLPAMLNAAPRLAVPLGRELSGLRQMAARRVIRQAAILSGLLGSQPIPLLDVPLQVMVQVGVVMRVGAAYSYTPTGGMNKEVMGTVISTLGMRYLALALAKLVPFVGWGVAGVVSSLMTVLIGEAAIRYYEAGATIPLDQFVKWPRRKTKTWQGKQKNQSGKAGSWWNEKFPRRMKWVTATSGQDEVEDQIIEVRES